MNELLCRIFIKSNLGEDGLPPPLDVLVLHLHRANYQTFIRKLACVLVLNLPTPLENDWVIENEKMWTELILSYY